MSDADLYSLTNALEGALSIHSATLDALSDLGWLRLMLVEHEVNLVMRAREEGHRWEHIAIALRRDPNITALMHRHLDVGDG